MNYVNYNYSFRRNMINEPSQLLASANIFTPTADQRFMLGCVFRFNDGRKFRYCKDGGSAQTKAQMGAALAIDAQSINVAQTGYPHATTGVAKFDVLMTTANGITDHCLIDGVMWVNQGAAAGLGDAYLIKDNIWTTSDTILNLEIADNAGLRNAIAATDEITVCRNICRDTKQHPTSHDSIAIGVPLVNVTASYYYWAQYQGWCPLLTEASETVVAGEKVGLPATPNTAGACGPLGADTDPVWGICICAAHAAQSTPDVALVNLLLP